MSLSIGSNNYVNTEYNTNTINNTTSTTTNNTTTSMTSDNLSLSTTTTTLPEQAGTWKKLSNSVGQMFSSIADKLGFGETYKVIAQEFKQVDTSSDGTLNKGEFNVATLNLFDFMGTEFARADKNRDGRVQEREYVDYRKQQLEVEFNKREKTGDNHINVNEIGFIGKQLLTNRDPRLDENQDGLLNKREFTRGAIRGAMSIRDLLGGM